MRKNILHLTIVLLSIFIFFYSTGLASDKFRFATTGATTDKHPFSQSMKWVQNTLERRIPEIDFKYYLTVQIGEGKEHLDMLMSGDLDYAALNAAELGRYLPEIGIFNAPYVFRDYDHAYKILEGDIGKRLNEKLIKELGIRLITPVEWGVRQLTTTNLPVRTPEDLKGAKIRVMDDKVSFALMESWYANPVPIAMAELYITLKQRIADGQENPITNIITNNLHEVQKYLILTGHVWNMGLGLINEAKFQSLSPEYQEILIDTLRAGGAVNDILSRQAEAEGYEYWKEFGNEIIEVDVEPFRQLATEKIFLGIRKNEWKDLWEEFQAAQ